jgi:hypothetical protein
MAIQFIVGFNERNLKLESALHTGLSRAKKAPRLFTARALE